MTLMLVLFSTNAYAINCGSSLFPRLCCDVFPNNDGCHSGVTNGYNSISRVSSKQLGQILNSSGLSLEEKKIIQKELKNRRK
jgi:hypothetical protein